MLPLIILNLLGCSEYDLKRTDIGPKLKIVYDTNNFGENKVVDSEKTTEEFRLYNVGEGTLLIDNLD